MGCFKGGAINRLGGAINRQRRRDKSAPPLAGAMNRLGGAMNRRRDLREI